MDELTLLRNIAQAANTTRDRQKNYFRTRSREILILSKSAEVHLDKLLDQYANRDRTPQPADLFDEAQPP